MTFPSALIVLALAAFWFGAPNFETWHWWPIGAGVTVLFVVKLIAYLGKDD